MSAAIAARSTGELLRLKLPDWLQARRGVASAVITQAEQLVGGHSNETWKISYVGHGDVASTSFVIRWGDPEGVQAPYDIPGQFRLLTALAQTAVPVPTALELEQDSSMIGAPFLTMRVAPGLTPNRFLELDDPLRDGKRTAHAEMLARIHAVDWRRQRLGELLPEPTPAHCAVEAIDQVRNRAVQRSLAGKPWVKHALAWLGERTPAQSEVGLLHGDPNLTNYRFDGTEIVAVLDWDAAMLSDPLWDVGAVSGAMWMYFADHPRQLQDCERETFLDLYHRASGRSLVNLHFWESLFVLRASILTFHPALDDRMHAIFKAKIEEITGFA